MNTPMNYNGYVVYGDSCGKALPFGIVTDGYRRKAITNYIPSSMVTALIAVEDKRFLNHGAIDIRSIVRGFNEVLLSHKEQIALLTILRGPNHYLKNPSEAIRRYTIINRLLVEQKLISSNRCLKNLANTPVHNPTEIGVVSNSIIPYVVRSVCDKSLSIQTTINLEVQKMLDAIIDNAPFPLSAVVVKNGRVVSIGSAFGKGYPVENKANVGSTLKPFIYTFLRESGIGKDEVFDATSNEIGIPVREAYSPPKRQLSISEALFFSNNNTFINASSKVGIEKTLDYISSLLCIDRSNVFPSSILGATKTGLSLVELALLYYNYFSVKSAEREETLYILDRYQESKLGYGQTNLFLKTGTTNNSRECYAILGNPEMVLAFLRNEDAELQETSKGISIVSYLKTTTTKEFINKILTYGRVSKR